MGAVFEKEFKSSMRTMTGPIFIAFLLLWFGIYTSQLNLEYGTAKFEYTIGYVAFLSLLALPLLTMRSFSEEKHNGSDKLLYSLPLKTGSIVMAKYLAALAIFAIPVVIIAVYPIILSQFGTIYLNTAYSSLIAYFLLGSSLIAIGLFISALTESQVIAAIISFGTIILMFYLSELASGLPKTQAFSFIFLIILALIVGVIAYVLTKSFIASAVIFMLGAAATLIAFIINKSAFEGLAEKWLSSLDIFERMNNFFYGIMDVEAIIFYVSITAFFLFLTSQAVEKRRWN